MKDLITSQILSIDVFQNLLKHAEHSRVIDALDADAMKSLAVSARTQASDLYAFGEVLDRIRESESKSVSANDPYYYEPRRCEVCQTLIQRSRVSVCVSCENDRCMY